MPAEFRRFHALVANGSLVPLNDGPDEQPLSVILSTPDGSHAGAARVAVGTREQVRDTLGILRRHTTPDSH